MHEDFVNALVELQEKHGYYLVGPQEFLDTHPLTIRHLEMGSYLEVKRVGGDSYIFNPVKYPTS